MDKTYLLTDKAREAFEHWLFTVRNEEIIDGQIEYDLYYMFMYMLPETCRNALIIEWLDSVEIYITLMGYDIAEPTFEYTIQEKDTLNGMNGFTFKSRHEATEKAIEKANEIYNQKIK